MGERIAALGERCYLCGRVGCRFKTSRRFCSGRRAKKGVFFGLNVAEIPATKRAPPSTGIKHGSRLHLEGCPLVESS